MSNNIVHLFKRKKEKCTGGSQMCETGNDTSTLAICLAVIIPVVLVIIVVGFFSYKAYKRNKKEGLDDNDPDFNVDNIVLPDFPNNSSMDPHFKSENPSQMQLNNPNYNRAYQFNNSVETFALPYINSKQDLDRYSKSLGYDFQDFNYPINKINSIPNSRKSSFSNLSKPLTGYDESSIIYKSDEKSEKFERSERSEKSFTNSTKGDNHIHVADLNTGYDSTNSSSVEEIKINDSNIPELHVVNDEDLINEKNSSIKSSPAPSIINEDPKDWEKNEIVEDNNNDNDNSQFDDDLPDFKKLSESDTPLSPEEEEQLNRMKSVYKLYFSRENSIKKKEGDNGPQFDDDNLPPLPTFPSQTKSKENLLLTVDNNGNGNHLNRASTSSSVYVPASENLAGGNFAHQQFKVLPNQQQYQQQYSQHPRQYPQQYPQQYAQQHPQQQYYQQQYPQQQQQQYPQQYYQQYPQNYQQQQYYHPQQQGNSIPLPKTLPNNLESLPLPHQLNKRASTLETFTTFSKDKPKTTRPPIQINQNFHPIRDINWSQTNLANPSPSQIRNSLVMYNPVEINHNNTFIYKGTAKEQIRNQSNNGGNGNYAMNSAASQTPLYHFDDYNYERPHGAENLIPKSGSQADLRKQMDNANV